MVKLYSIYMFRCYPSGFASRNVSAFYWPIWSYDFVNRFCSPYQKGGGHTYSSPYGCAFFKDKSFVCKPAGTFLQWHRCSAEQKRRHKNESRMKEKEKASSKVFRLEQKKEETKETKIRKERKCKICAKLPYHQSFLFIRCWGKGANSPLRVSFEHPGWCGMLCWCLSGDAPSSLQA